MTSPPSRRSFMGSLLAGIAGAGALFTGHRRVARAALPTPTPTPTPEGGVGDTTILHRQPCTIPLDSGLPILPGTTAQISVRPGLRADTLLVDRLVIGPTQESTPDDWIVHDVRVEWQSQLRSSGGVPGRMFSPKVRCPPSLIAPIWDPCRPWQALCVQIAYVGSRPEGANFYAWLTGTNLIGDGPIAEPIHPYR